MRTQPEFRHRQARDSRRERRVRIAWRLVAGAICILAALALSVAARAAYLWVAEGPDTTGRYNEAAYMASETLLAGGNQ